MSDIPHLLPPSASHMEVALSRAMARLANVPPFCRQMWDPATCPPSHLPWLAWAVSVDEWDSAWSDAQKRGVIEASYQVHRHKGTVGAVRRALAAFVTKPGHLEFALHPQKPLSLLDLSRLAMTDPTGMPDALGLTAVAK